MSPVVCNQSAAGASGLGRAPLRVRQGASHTLQSLVAPLADGWTQKGRELHSIRHQCQHQATVSSQGLCTQSRCTHVEYVLIVACFG